MPVHIEVGPPALDEEDLIAWLHFRLQFAPPAVGISERQNFACLANLDHVRLLKLRYRERPRKGVTNLALCIDERHLARGAVSVCR